MAAAINTQQVEEGPGCSAFAAAVAATVLLAITIPIGAIGFVLFLLLALLVFRKKPHTLKPTTEEPRQS